MKVHPAAKIFPMMEGNEFAEFKADIEANGLREPIVVYQGMILDGRNRMLACEQLDPKVKPEFREWRPTKDQSPTALVLSSNLHRRHLTPTQRAVIAVASLPFFASEAKTAQARGGKAGKRGHKVVQKNTSLSNENKATTRAGAAVNVSGSIVAKAKRVITKAPDLKDSLIDGTLTISQAESVMRFEPDERKEVVERIKSGDAKDIKTAVIHMSEEGRCPIAINPSFEAKHDFGAKWSKVFRTLKTILSGIRFRGGIERFSSQWSDDRRRTTATEMRSLVTEIQGFISFLEGGSNGTGQGESETTEQYHTA